MHLFEDIVCFRKGAAVPILLGITMLLSGCGQSQSSGGGQAVTLQVPSLIFSTYLGGSQPCCASCTSAHTFAQNTASDIRGNTYVTGATEVSDLPVKNAWQPNPSADSTLSAFVAKFDPAGNVVITALTFSNDFPVKNPVQTWPNDPGNQNAFVTKFWGTTRGRR